MPAPDRLHPRLHGYLGKASAALHPGDPVAGGQWADGQLLPRHLLCSARKTVAATLASVAAKTRANPRTRHLDLDDMDKAVTYLKNNHNHMRYDKALAAGWPIATGMIEGACRFVIEDRFGITGATWLPDGAEDILKLRAVVVNGDLDHYMRYYKQRYRDEHHLARYDPATIEDLNLAACKFEPWVELGKDLVSSHSGRTQGGLPAWMSKPPSANTEANLSSQWKSPASVISSTVSSQGKRSRMVVHESMFIWASSWSWSSWRLAAKVLVLRGQDLRCPGGPGGPRRTLASRPGLAAGRAACGPPRPWAGGLLRGGRG